MNVTFVVFLGQCYLCDLSSHCYICDLPSSVFLLYFVLGKRYECDLPRSVSATYAFRPGSVAVM